MRSNLRHLCTALSVVFAFATTACDGDVKPQQPPPSEPPTYLTKAPASSSWNGGGRGTAQIEGLSGAPVNGDTGKGTTTSPQVPGGRVADVQEADVYRMRDGKLFLLNTYRGFLIYDVSNPKQPQRLAQLPVYGYPVEMFVENNTVYALLSDALYLTKVEGSLRFERRNSSQIVTIDITDPLSPKILQAQDLAGQLREGVSRKIESSIYVVSYQPAGYWYYGWGPQNGKVPNEEAWVYSFDASTPSNLKLVQRLKVFEGGSSESYNAQTGESHGRYSQGVTLSATSNAIMVVQNWYTSDSVPGKPIYGSGGPDAGAVSYECGSSRSDQESVVSVVDVSDAKGSIRVAATFSMQGALTDQFKQTYIHDAAANTGTYIGIFARSVWAGDKCNWSQYTQNTIAAWDIVGDGTATKLSAIDFGKPNETVRGSYFDPTRSVAFAITAQRMDPMYAISFADRKQLKILSAIDGLSGDMDLFRPVQDGQYLLAVGRDTGDACAGYVSKSDGSRTPWASQISVSLIDVRDLANIRLVQRKCLDIANAGWVSSAVTWNLDQAHKMIGLSTEGATNVLTVPVSYSVEDDSAGDWYWYRYETAVGIMGWDLSRYDPALLPEQQSVIQTHGHFVHPNGEVNRSVVYTQADGQREMLNISDTHLSFANLQSLASPTLDSVVEIASGTAAVFAFGAHVVEQVTLPSAASGSGSGYRFRVKAAGAAIDDAPILAEFTVGQVQQVIRHGSQLVFLRALPKTVKSSSGYDQTVYTTQVLVYDLSNPLYPVPVGSVELPEGVSPYGSYYRYYCAMDYYCGYSYGYVQGMASVDDGIVFLSSVWSEQKSTVTLDGGGTQTRTEWSPKYSLALLDLRNPAKPTVSKVDLSLPGTDRGTLDSASIVPDGDSTKGFYLAYRVRVDSSVDPTTNTTIYSFANYAQRWEPKAGAWIASNAVNIPGTLVRAWTTASGVPTMLTREDIYTSTQVDGYWQWNSSVTMRLAQIVTAGNGKLAAVLLDSKEMSEALPKSIVYAGDRMYMVLSTAYAGGYWTEQGLMPTTLAGPGDVGSAAAIDTSDRIVVVDMSAGTLAVVSDQATGLSNVGLMGVLQNKMFVDLTGDGILVVDVAAAPQAQSFYRTLGYVSGFEAVGSHVYLPAYYYGAYHFDMTAPGNL